MSLFKIEQALQKALNNVSGIPSVAWPNVKFEPAVGTAFLRPTLLPAKTDTFTLNEYNKHSGIYQIDIYVPNDKGIKDMYTLADSIKDYYQNNKRLVQGGQIVFVMSVGIGKSERQDAWYSTFVEIQYISYN